MVLWLFGCLGELSGPVLVEVSPDVVCQAGAVVLTADGVGPVVVDPLAEEPQLRWPELLVRGTETLPLGEPEWEEGSVELQLPPLESGSWEVVLRDPFGQESASPLLVTGRPEIHGAVPDQVCHELGVQAVSFSGVFRMPAGELPIVRVDGREQTVVGAEGCTGDFLQTCSVLNVQFDPSTVPLGLVDVEIEGPLDDCLSAETFRLQVVSSPRILGVEDREVCDGGGTVVVVGEGFTEDMEVLLEGAPVEFTLLDPAHLEVAVPALEEGSYALSLNHPNGCSTELDDAVRVATAPVMFFVDPPRVWGGLQNQEVTAYIADVTDVIDNAWIKGGDGITPIQWSWEPEEPGLLYATVPASSLGAGEYKLKFSQGGECSGEAAGVFEIRGGVGLELIAVEPSLAWAYDRTPITIRASGGLQEVPRVYLVNPQTGQTERLLGVYLLNDRTLTATVPEGLEPGVYHLLVYNPDESFGRLLEAVEVTQDTPPRIDSVRPATLPRGNDETFEVRGRGFRDAEVWLDCGNGDSVWGIVTAETPSRLQVQANTGSTSPTVCTVQVVNGDGTDALFAAVTITNPSQNLFDWSAGPDLVHARRAPATAAVRANALNRYVVVMGGDEGDVSSARDTVEVSPVGVYGELGDFEVIPGPLPRDRTLAQAVAIDQMVYLVGGNNGVKAGSAVYRARMLDPLDVPLFETVSMRSGSGMAEGTWVYRVSALYAADDDSNPGGESLASDPMTLTLPFEGIQPSISWTAMADAVGYRVYRSSLVDSPYGEEEWLADVTLPEFTDIGGTTDASVTPLPVGSLGEWANVAGLTVSREGACVTTVPDNSPDPEVVWILAAGGRDDDGNILDTIEALEVRVEGARTQTVGAWTVLPETLSEPGWACGAWSLDYRWHSVVDPGESWYYVGGGHGENGISGVVDAFRIGGSDLLTDRTTVDQLSPPRAGFAAASGSNFLYALGGQQGQPSDRGVSAEIDTPPDFKNWNSLAESLVMDRYLPGVAQQSAVFLILGGETDTEAATHSTEWTNY